MMEDTIAAVATAPGEGGIGIIRISGGKAPEILRRIVALKRAETLSAERAQDVFENRRLYYGHVIDDETLEMIDEVLAVHMKAPGTYTREEMVEIHCHGNMIALRKTLELALRHGARLAEKGEFTKRAFMNGRLDLSQAEAVMDMISAKTDTGYEVAVSQLEGSLSEKVGIIRDAILQILAHVVVNLDYPDADVEEMTYEALGQALLAIRADIERMVETAETGKIIREGLKTVIIGKPNVGKSSLLNALLREARAIVTEIPGTTRDTIEEIINIRGIPIRLVDTAGIRETEDVIEKIGIEKSKQSFNQADLVILILNASEELSREDADIIDHIRALKTIVLLNKTDLGRKISEGDVRQALPGASVIETAIPEGLGIQALEDVIAEFVYGGRARSGESLLITNARHKNLLVQAGSAISDAQAMCSSGEALDFIEVDIRRAWELLGEIIGESVAEDIVDEVFARFCLGK